MAFVECYKKHYIVYSLLIGIIIAAAVVVPTTVVLVKDKDNKHNHKHDTNIEDKSIDIPQNFNYTRLLVSGDVSNLTSWNVVKYVYGDNNWNIVDNNTASVVYPAKSANPSSDTQGGFNFYVSPHGVFPAQEVYLSYQVKFTGDDSLNRKMLATGDFDWVKGGMLPGLWIGRMGALDTNYIEDGASCRIMWRKNGMAEAYLYVDTQTPEFYKLPGYFNNKPYGESMYRGFAEFVLGNWNTVVLRIKLNTVGQNDGILQISINNRTLTYDKMNWRSSESVSINGIVMHSFFGGSDDSWATSKEQKVLFSKFTVYA